MKKHNRSIIIIGTMILIMFIGGCASRSYEDDRKGYGYEWGKNKELGYGYEWAEENDIDNFENCQDEFGTGEKEDDCNEYVKESHTGYKTFHGYKCSEDCDGNKAGYEWARKKGITNSNNCGGKSQSFIDGCKAYADEH